jgi:hypothetical protein
LREERIVPDAAAATDVIAQDPFASIKIPEQVLRPID